MARLSWPGWLHNEIVLSARTLSPIPLLTELNVEQLGWSSCLGRTLHFVRRCMRDQIDQRQEIGLENRDGKNPNPNSARTNWTRTQVSPRTEPNRTEPESKKIRKNPNRTEPYLVKNRRESESKCHGSYTVLSLIYTFHNKRGILNLG